MSRRPRRNHTPAFKAKRGVGRDRAVTKRSQVPASLFSAWARRTLPLASAATRTSSLCGPPLPRRAPRRLHERADRLTVRAHHRRAQLVQPGPGGLVGAEAHDALQVLARDARAARRDLEDRAERHLQGLARFLQHRPRREARLMAAVGALERGALADRPHALALAPRTGRLAAPTRLDQIGAAILLGQRTAPRTPRRLRKITPQVVAASTESAAAVVGSRSRADAAARDELHLESPFAGSRMLATV